MDPLLIPAPDTERCAVPAVMRRKVRTTRSGRGCYSRYNAHLKRLECTLDHQKFPDEASLLNALAHMEAALHLLDDADSPADIGAHLDLAICRAKDCLVTATSANSMNKQAVSD